MPFPGGRVDRLPFSRFISTFLPFTNLTSATAASLSYFYRLDPAPAQLLLNHRAHTVARLDS